MVATLLVTLPSACCHLLHFRLLLGPPCYCCPPHQETKNPTRNQLITIGSALFEENKDGHCRKLLVACDGGG
jgi:hypothetical protein